MSMPDARRDPYPASSASQHGSGMPASPFPTALPQTRLQQELRLQNSTRDEAKHWMKAHRTIIASSLSSILSTLSAFPLDSVKTRMQAYRYSSVADCVTHSYHNEGVKGFWRGALAPLFSVTLVRTASFSIYQHAKYKYSAAIGRFTGGEEPLKVVNRPGSTPTIATLVCFGAAGATAGATISVVACPFELTKLSAQISTLMAKRNHANLDNANVRSSYEQKGTFATAKNIVVNRGLTGMYSGFRLHLLRDSIGTIIYFSTYESTKQMIVKLQKSNSPTSPLSVAAAGGLCGLVSWACIYPIDTAKTHYQRNCLATPRGQKPKISKIQFFNRHMYSGIGVSMARSCLINTIFFSSFEFLKKEINNLPDPVADAHGEPTA